MPARPPARAQPGAGGSLAVREARVLIERRARRDGRKSRGWAICESAGLFSPLSLFPGFDTFTNLRQ